MANLDDSADIFANSSTETVTENIDYSEFLNENNYIYKRNDEENFEMVLRPQKNELIRMKRPFCTSSPLAETSTAFKSNISCTSMNVSFITNQFISEACNVPVTLYCPFCPDEFKLEFLLKDHIKVTHPNELRNIIRRDDDECVEFNPCPFCHATFYVKELLPKHIVRKHEESVMSMFTDVNPDRYAHCPFCSHKVLMRHSKLLINHIEKKHSDEFHLAINMKCSNALLNSYDLSFFDYKARRNASDCSSLVNGMVGLSTSGSNIKNNKTKQIKSILKKTTSYPDGLNSDNLDGDNIDDKELSTFSLNNSSFMERRNARRRLRFELPPLDSPTSDDENKENSIFHPNKKRNFTSEKPKSKWRNLFSFKKKDSKTKKSNAKITTRVTDKSKLKSSPKITGNHKKQIQTTPVYSSVGFKVEGVSHLAVTQFKCGLCLEGFTKNALLLEHLRRNHKGIKLVPQYRCGECEAKFFRNSFLVRHCWFHHTPKCLKTASNEALK